MSPADQLVLLGAADAAAMAAIHQTCFAEPWLAQHFTALLDQPLYWAAGWPGSGTALAAFVVALRAGPDDVEIITLAVAPSARRQGLGQTLMEAVMAWGRDGGARQLILEVHADNEPALGLYKTLGMEEIGRRRGYYRDPPGDALVLSRLL